MTSDILDFIGLLSEHSRGDCGAALLIASVVGLSNTDEALRARNASRDIDSPGTMACVAVGDSRRAELAG